jgi:UDP-N-acetylglucosamine 4,6-dehydratase
VIGDVRDKDRLSQALSDVDIVIHAAALKQVPMAEVNPLEAIKTNVLGSANVIDAAMERGVKRVVALSTDKAANPINLYGATKLCADKLFIAANNTLSASAETRFSVVRYGNVVGSRGSVIPYFLAQRPTGQITITDARMTRFLITLEQGVRFVIRCAEMMMGGEIFVPKIPSVRITDLARVIAPECVHRVVGIRPGEKLHELMVTADDARLTVEFEDHYLIQPTHDFWNPMKASAHYADGKPCADGFVYSSDTNSRWFTDDEIAVLVSQTQNDAAFTGLPKSDEPRFIVGG